MNDYLAFRGKCKELAEAACQADTKLRLVRGYYHCPFWGKQAHWWGESQDGTVTDPSSPQFPSKGMGDYEEYDGNVECANCGTAMPEDDAWRIEGRYCYCSSRCYGQFVGVI